MKRNISLLGVFVLLLLANNVLAQRVPTKGTKVIPSTTRKAADKKEETQQGTQQGMLQGIDLNNKNPNTAQPTIDLKNVNQTVNVPDKSALESLIIRHFNGLKTGSPSQKQGASELLIADRLFPVLNTTKIITREKTSTLHHVTTTQSLEINVNVQDFAHFSDKPDTWLKPGQIISAQSFLSDNESVTVSIPRNPISLTINLPGVANKSRQVQNPEQASKLLEAEDYLIAQNARIPAPKLSFSFQKIHSVEDLEIKLTGKYRNALQPFANGIGLSGGSTQIKHFYMLEFKQKMFSIQAAEMPKSNIYKQSVTDMSDQVYIDKVDYGRSGIIIFKCPLTLEEMGITAAANYLTGLSEDEMRATYKQLIAKKGVIVYARFSGGASAQSNLSMENTVKNGVENIFTHIRALPNNHQLAVPISYTLKNMNNQRIGQKTYKTQTIKIRTLVPPKPYLKLKVTLTDIQVMDARDKDRKDDFGIQQYIEYKALGKEKKYNSRDIRKFPNLIDRGGQVPGIINPVVMGGMDAQIHVNENRNIYQRNRNMINNSLVFHITPEELNDPNASFEIFTWLKEYSMKDRSFPIDKVINKIGDKREDKVYLNNEPVRVNIKDIVEILYGSRELKEKTIIPNSEFSTSIKFHNFDDNTFLPVANIQKKIPLVLEGPMVIKRIEYEYETVIAIWIQFELLQ